MLVGPVSCYAMRANHRKVLMFGDMHDQEAYTENKAGARSKDDVLLVDFFENVMTETDDVVLLIEDFYIGKSYAYDVHPHYRAKKKTLVDNYLGELRYAFEPCYRDEVADFDAPTEYATPEDCDIRASNRIYASDLRNADKPGMIETLAKQYKADNEALKKVTIDFVTHVWNRVKDGKAFDLKFFDDYFLYSYTPNPSNDLREACKHAQQLLNKVLLPRCKRITADMRDRLFQFVLHYLAARDQDNILMYKSEDTPFTLDLILSDLPVLVQYVILLETPVQILTYFGWLHCRFHAAALQSLYADFKLVDQYDSDTMNLQVRPQTLNFFKESTSPKKTQKSPRTTIFVPLPPKKTKSPKTKKTKSPKTKSPKTKKTNAPKAPSPKAPSPKAPSPKAPKSAAFQRLLALIPKA